VNVVVVGTLAMVNVPAYPEGVTPPSVTDWPADRPCAALVVTVTTCPLAVAVAEDSVGAVATASFCHWNVFAPTGAVTVLVPLKLDGVTPAIVTTSFTTKGWFVAVVTFTVEELLVTVPPVAVRDPLLKLPNVAVVVVGTDRIAHVPLN
jgi:hypothetical protein